jgi:hypothetical protein
VSDKEDHTDLKTKPVLVPRFSKSSEASWRGAPPKFLIRIRDGSLIVLEYY